MLHNDQMISIFVRHIVSDILNFGILMSHLNSANPKTLQYRVAQKSVDFNFTTP